MDSRRDFLRKAGLLTGTLAMSNVIPMSIQRAMAIQADPGTTFYDAEHIVFLMQENRSFDHMFGSMRGVRGFHDPRAKTLPNGHKVWLQNDAKGNTFAPFHVDIHKTKITWQGGLPHSWPDQVAARNKGKYDKWIPAKSLMCMGYYKREDIPFYYAMADAFTVCDHHFCSSLTGTTPNRLFFWTGTVRPEQDANSVAVVNNSQAESRDNIFVDWQTFPEVLEDNGISWKVYQNELWTADVPGDEVDNWLGNYGDNPLEYVKRHRVKLSAYFRKNGDETSHPALSAEEVLERYNRLSQREKNLIDKAFATNIDNPDYLELAPFTFRHEEKEETLWIPKEDIFENFRKDVDGGKLPTVSWLVAPQRFSDHTSTPLYGVWYVSEALDILTKNPEVWKKTIFILTYDENDGYFDHLPPFVAPRPDDRSAGKVSRGLEPWADYEYRKNSPIGLGYRVPMVIASPWSKGGYVNSQIFDHTSSLMFLEDFLSKKTGRMIKSDNISPWRRAICGDLTSAFRPYMGEHISVPERLERGNVITGIHQAKTKPAQVTPQPLTSAEIVKINTRFPFAHDASEQAPVQEKGVRPACALPYFLQTDARLNDDGTALVVNFKADEAPSGVPLKASGVAFNVYTPGSYADEAGRTWAYAVKAGDAVHDEWELDAFKAQQYDLHVHGPNGFFRAFKGGAKTKRLHIQCAGEQQALRGKYSGNLKLTIHNGGEKAIELQIKSDTYGAKDKIIRVPANNGKIVVFDLGKQKGWYDFKIMVTGDPEFCYQYAGHMETGAESISDPLMGGVIS